MLAFPATIKMNTFSTFYFRLHNSTVRLSNVLKICYPMKLMVKI